MVSPCIASHGLGSDIFTGFEVIAILRWKRFRLFLETAVSSTQYAKNNNSNKLRVSILSCVQV